jgi:hypothetical protein
MGQVQRAVHERDLTAFVRGLQREPWLLGEAFVWFQVALIGGATLNDREEFIVALLDLDPALLRRQPPPPSQAIEFAFTYANTHLIPVLAGIWPVPDDLLDTALAFSLINRHFDVADFLLGWRRRNGSGNTDDEHRRWGCGGPIDEQLNVTQVFNFSESVEGSVHFGAIESEPTRRTNRIPPQASKFAR